MKEGFNVGITLREDVGNIFGQRKWKRAARANKMVKMVSTTQKLAEEHLVKKRVKNYDQAQSVLFDGVTKRARDGVDEGKIDFHFSTPAVSVGQECQPC